MCMCEVLCRAAGSYGSELGGCLHWCQLGLNTTLLDSRLHQRHESLLLTLAPRALTHRCQSRTTRPRSGLHDLRVGLLRLVRPTVQGIQHAMRSNTVSLAEYNTVEHHVLRLLAGM